MSVVTAGKPFAICNHRAIEYANLLDAVSEVIGGNGLLTMAVVKPLNVAVDEVRYTRETSYMPVPIKSSHTASISVVDGVLTSDEFTMAGDHVFNPSGYMVAVSGPEPLLGDLLAQSYAAMGEGSHSVANAFIKAVYLVLRLIMENNAPSLEMSELSGIVPYVL